MVKTCGSGFFDDHATGFLILLFVFDDHPVLEACTGTDDSDEARLVDGAPPVLGDLDELERHRQPGRSRAGTPVPRGVDRASCFRLGTGKARSFP
jgi:hypothetical protein